MPRVEYMALWERPKVELRFKVVVTFPEERVELDTIRLVTVTAIDELFNQGRVVIPAMEMEHVEVKRLNEAFRELLEKHPTLQRSIVVQAMNEGGKQADRERRSRSAVKRLAEQKPEETNDENRESPPQRKAKKESHPQEPGPCWH